MRLSLPFASGVLAATSCCCCCCGDLFEGGEFDPEMFEQQIEQALQEAGIEVPDAAGLPAAELTGALAGMPVHPDLSLIGTSAVGDAESANFETAVTPADVVSWYKTELGNQGWVVNEPVTTASLASINARSGEKALSVNATEQGGKTYVSLTIMSAPAEIVPEPTPAEEAPSDEAEDEGAPDTPRRPGGGDGTKLPRPRPRPGSGR